MQPDCIFLLKTHVKIDIVMDILNTNNPNQTLIIDEGYFFRRSE